MARLVELAPSAASLSLSLRDIGYSLETAVADLVDNSITAGASAVEIVCSLGSSAPMVAITDNGCGMTSEELLSAMKHGGRCIPKSKAGPDLGRFGLGLKTASFSQCRQLTVVSSINGVRAGAQWDLDLVSESDTWNLSVLDENEVAGLLGDVAAPRTGTVVLWRKLDRLFEEEVGIGREDTVAEKLSLLRDHLALVFHRFLSGDMLGTKLSLGVNGLDIQPFDPFCRSNRATQRLPKEVVSLGDHRIEIQPYVLPHHSHLSEREYQFYRTRSDFLSNQGAYIYRNGRLMAWGDWFRLVPKGESTKLGRVQIDFPSELDEAWTIDIKKSRATPPRVVREQVRQILPRIVGSAVRVHRGRGKKLYEESEAPIWNRYSDQDRVRYTVNHDHPIVQALEGRLDEPGKRNLRMLLESVASALPIEMIYSDYSLHPRDTSPPKLESDAIRPYLRELRFLVFPNQSPSPKEFREVVVSMGLFATYPDEVDRYIEEELQA